MYSTITDGVVLNLAGHPLKNNSVFHKAIELNFFFIPSTDEWFYDYDNFDFNAINAYISMIDWKTLFHDLNVNDCVDSFYFQLYDAIARFVPKKKKRLPKSRPWLSSELRHLRNVKNRAHHKFIDTQTEMDFMTFFSLSEEFNDMNQVAYKAYITRVGVDLKTNPKKFWNLINSKRKSNQLPKCIFFLTQQMPLMILVNQLCLPISFNQYTFNLISLIRE